MHAHTLTQTLTHTRTHRDTHTHSQRHTHSHTQVLQPSEVDAVTSYFADGETEAWEEKWLVEGTQPVKERARPQTKMRTLSLPLATFTAGASPTKLLGFIGHYIPRNTITVLV